MSERKHISREPLSLFPATSRQCSRCKQRLPLDQFSMDPRLRDGLNSKCRECISATNKAYSATRKPQISAAHRRRKYGLSEDAYQAMIASQDDLCAICENPMRKKTNRHVDHCHTSGRVRALLCNRCNTILGRMEESPELLRAMASYIERYR